MDGGKDGERPDIILRHAVSLPVAECGGLDVEVGHYPLATDTIEGGCVMVKFFAHSRPLSLHIRVRNGIFGVD